MSGDRTPSWIATAAMSQHGQDEKIAERDLRQETQHAEEAEEHAGGADDQPLALHRISTRASHLVFSTPARFGAMRRSG